MLRIYIVHFNTANHTAVKFAFFLTFGSSISHYVMKLQISI